jgi:hypothetical protein
MKLEWNVRYRRRCAALTSSGNLSRRGKIPYGPHPRSNNVKQHIPEEFSTRLIHWGPFVIMGNTVPPRDPDEDEDDAEDNADEPPVVREPDED